jgi:hypothetical protein
MSLRAYPTPEHPAVKAAGAVGAARSRPMQNTLAPTAFMSRLFGFSTPERPRVTRRYAAHVRQGATREIVPPSGRITVHLRGGEAWITHDGDPRDVMLQANESYIADNGGRMTLHALRGDCVLEIQVDD